MTIAEMTSFVIQPFAHEPFANPNALDSDSLNPFELIVWSFVCGGVSN
jgi:hypothetical protein